MILVPQLGVAVSELGGIRVFAQSSCVCLTLEALGSIPSTGEKISKPSSWDYLTGFCRPPKLEGKEAVD